MLRLVVAIVATAVLTLAGAIALHVEVPNARADGPQMDSQADLIDAFTAGCVAQLGVVKAETQAGIVHLQCRPGVGVVAVPKGGR
jgi:hypothetical protein